MPAMYSSFQDAANMGVATAWGWFADGQLLDLQGWLADILSTSSRCRFGFCHRAWSLSGTRQGFESNEDMRQMFRSVRHFVLFSYKGDRGELLLRSRQSIEFPTRLDVLITDVSAFEVRCWSDSLTIEETGIQKLEGKAVGPTTSPKDAGRFW